MSTGHGPCRQCNGEGVVGINYTDAEQLECAECDGTGFRNETIARRMEVSNTGNDLSDTLAMLASQLRESLDDPRNQPPHPWRFDDWLAEYRSWHEQQPK